MVFSAITGRLMRHPGLLVLLLGVGLSVLAVLQYHWLTQLSAVEHERKQANLAAAASLFREDFDRELTRAFGTFQSAFFGDIDGLDRRLLDQHARWMDEAPFAPMVRDVYWMNASSPEQPLRLSVEEQTFVPSELPADVRLEDVQAAARFDAAGSSPRSAAVLSDPPLFVIPHFVGTEPARAAQAEGWLLVVLDGEFLRETLMPSLLDRYALGEEYDVLIRGPFGPDSTLYRSSTNVAFDDFLNPDIDLELGRIRTEDFLFRMLSPAPSAAFFEAAAAGSGTAGNTTLRGQVSLFAQAGETDELNGAVSDSGGASRRLRAVFTFGDSARTGDAPRSIVRRVDLAAAGRLLIKHRSGSVEAAVAGVRARNLIVSFGILLLLAGSMTLIVVSARRAERLSTQQVQFIAGVSHELCTPLAVIHSAAANLSDGVVSDPEQARRYGNVIREEGRRLNEMVEQILLFSGLKTRGQSLQRSPVAVREIVERAVETQRIPLEKSEVTVEVSIPSKLPPIDVDAPAVTSAVSNLIGNAVKYAGSSKRIEIEAKERADRAGREVEITVCDEGPGVDPDERAMIFEPFYRGRDAVASQIRGSGLGLSLVKQIVEAHGGRIELRTGPGKGACFSICLPTRGDDAPTSRDGADGEASG